MAEPIGPRITGMQHDVDQIKKALMDRSVDNSSGNRSQIILNLNAGKFSTWAAAATCLLVLAFFSGAALTAGLWFSREFTKMDGRFSDLKNTDDIHDAYLEKIRAKQQQLEKK